MNSIDLKIKTVKVEVGTRKVNATWTKEMVKDIYKMSGMSMKGLRKSTINKILNTLKQSDNSDL